MLRTHGLALDEDPENLIEKSDRRQSKFRPGKQPKRRPSAARRSAARPKKAATKKAPAKKPAKKAPAKKPAKKTRAAKARVKAPGKQAKKRVGGRRTSPARKKASRRKATRQRGAKVSTRARQASLFGKKKKKPLTKKQLAQRKYAAQMQGVRKRASASKGGSGPIAERRAATELRRKLGVKSPKKKPAAKKRPAKKRSSGKRKR